MKKLMLLMSFALVLIFGCAKEETTPTALSTDDQNVEESSVWVINTNSDNPEWELVTLDELPSTQSSSGSSATSRSNSSHTHGDFASFGSTVSWSGTENNGGAHGSALVVQSFGPFTVQVVLETECIMAEGDEAVYGGTITELIDDPFGGNGPYAVGAHMYFKVIDNGQGNNAPADQNSTLILLSPDSRCGEFPPSNSIWTDFGNIVDVQDPGSVKVNN